MSKNVWELKEALDNFVFNREITRRDGSTYTYGYKGIDHWPIIGNIDTEVPGVGTVRVVDFLGGKDGYGENIHIVFQITSGDVTRFYKIDGYYTSYDGSDYSGALYEVKPVQQVVTTFEGV